MRKTIHISAWVAQIILSASLIWAGGVKLFQPIGQLKTMWPWTGEVSPMFVKMTGIIDLLGALGLLLPALLRIKPVLTPVAALGIVLLMIVAGAFHILRGESEQIGVNIAFGIIAGFIAFARFRIAPIPSK